MTITIGNLAVVATLFGICGTIIHYARRGFQFMELLLKTVLWASRQRGAVNDVPDWLAKQYKDFNGNAHASQEEKHDLLGARHDSGEHRAASAGE